MPTDGGPAQFSDEHRAAIQRRQLDQDRTLTATHQLEEALGRAAPGRASAWQEAVRAALDDLGAATREEAQHAEDPLSLLSDVARTQPRLRHRVNGLRAQYRQVRDTIDSLRSELTNESADIDAADLRQRLAWPLMALRHQRARESDLIYEAYFEAFNRDLAGDSVSGPSSDTA